MINVVWGVSVMMLNVAFIRKIAKYEEKVRNIKKIRNL